jgi:hypothetical protein
MRRLLAIAAALGIATPSPPLAAQATLHATFGARYTSALVHDSIVTALDVRPDIAPAVTLTLGLPLDGPWRLDVLVDVSTSPVQRHDADGFAFSITRLWMLGAGVGLRRRLSPWLEGRAAVGVLKLLPAESVGLFEDGGGAAPFASMALTLAPPPVAPYGMAFEIAGDAHRFQTAALRDAGFTASRLVYRLTAGIRARVWSAR